MNPIDLSIYASLFWSLCEEMGRSLMRSAFSPNIKERRDYSTALFTPDGHMVAQADHMPVHLGSMGFALQGILGRFPLNAGDMALLNDPYCGGTHLPDLTLIAPVHDDGLLLGYVANRAHHSDIGGSSPGSMPVAHTLEEEGLVIPPTLLVRGGEIVRDSLDWIRANVRVPEEREGDLRAQIASNVTGIRRLVEMVQRRGVDEVRRAFDEVLRYGARTLATTLAEMPCGTFTYEDVLDDDGFGNRDIRIACRLTLDGHRALVDFDGSAHQVEGNLNAVYPVTFAATAYCFRCLMPEETPSSSGCFEHLDIRAPRGSVLNPSAPAPVAAGNVETSQRIVDVVFGALAQALPDRVPASSAGTMNNLAFGGIDPATGKTFSYYETIAGGMGGRPGRPGLDAVQTHMTNTLNTPVEALELHYPLRLRRYALRRGSGGEGLHRGGDGVVRELEILTDAELSILSERRLRGPPGARGGRPGSPGRNRMLTEQGWLELPGKVRRPWKKGEILRIETPGGGGWGSAQADEIGQDAAEFEEG